MCDSYIDRVYKYLEINFIPKIKNDSPEIITRYLVENIHSNLTISIDVNLTEEYIDNRLRKIDEYKKQLEKIKEIPIIEQRSDEWFSIRRNLITASDMAQALNKGKFGTQKDFLIKKIGNLMENNNKYIQSDNSFIQ